MVFTPLVCIQNMRPSLLRGVSYTAFPRAVSGKLATLNVLKRKSVFKVVVLSANCVRMIRFHYMCDRRLQ